MIVEIKEVPHLRYKTVMRKILVKKCDQCEKLEEVGFKQHLLDRQIHFCSKECLDQAAMKGGSLQEKKRQTSIDRYGVDFPMQSSVVKSHVQQTNFEKHGVHWFTQSTDFKDKMKQTMVKRYGVEFTLQADQFKAKARQTKLKRYGHICNMAAPGIKETFDRQEMAKKCHETKKKNGSYTSSKAERMFYELLVEHFGDVERSDVINGWQIDFFVHSLNAHIQFDGVYWHGLDRPILAIQESSRKRDKVIYKTFLRDSQQRVWFDAHQKILVRITDREFAKLGRDVISLIKERCA